MRLTPNITQAILKSSESRFKTKYNIIFIDYLHLSTTKNSGKVMRVKDFFEHEHEHDYEKTG